MESEAGIYHVISRGNYRANVFQAEQTKRLFLDCVKGACERTGWLIHAWGIMSNHYHLTISTPGANLVEGMKWLLGTFAGRFNRRRQERGHLFQGRYKSLIIEPGEGLGWVCHYVHLNPVRARLCAVRSLRHYPWTSVRWLYHPLERPPWYDPLPCLRFAGDLADTPADRDQYIAYLEWLAENEPAQKQQFFDRMSKGWVIGGATFASAMMQEHRDLAGRGPGRPDEIRKTLEAQWDELLEQELKRAGRTRLDIPSTGKSADWKLAIAAAMKARSTVTNRWLSTHLLLGALHEVSRKVSQWNRRAAPR